MRKKAVRRSAHFLPILLVVVVTFFAHALSNVTRLATTQPKALRDAPLERFRDAYFPPQQKHEPPADTATHVEPPRVATYIQITDSCGPHYEGVCVNGRREPSTTSPAVVKLRTGVVLKTDGMVDAPDGRWYKVIFDEWIRYPERMRGPFYVREAFATSTTLVDPDHASSTEKRIVIDRSAQTLTAYDELGEVFMEETISTGRDATPTPRGTFTVFRKTPSRYMQGPLPGISADYYDLPGVPWNMYFTEQGGAIHGAYWHDKFGQQWSHGCVNLPVAKARELYLWAGIGTKVTIHD
jgi:hypothetical protein